MKPPPFRYEAPGTVDEAVGMLGRWGDEAKVLAGGQSLMPLLAFRLARPSVLIDINRIPGLEYTEAAAGRLVIGSLTRHRAMELAPPAQLPAAIREAAAQIGHVAVRNRGTVGGSLAHADPSAEWAAVALAFDGVIVAAGSAGQRRIPAGDFFTGFLTSALEPAELVIRLELELPPQPAGSAFTEFARRDGDFALAGVAAVLGLTPAQQVRHARLAVIGAAVRPARCPAAEAALAGREFTAAAAEDAARVLADDLELAGADDDERRFRLHIARTLTRRALSAAAGRALAEAA